VRKALEFLGVVESGAAVPRSSRADEPRRAAPKPVVRISNSNKGRDTGFATIHTIRPRRYQTDAEGIALTFREGSPVIVDLGQLPESDVRRMIDFLSGLVSGLEGTLRKVSGKVWMVTPYGIEQFEESDSENGLNDPALSEMFD
jgi:cell division inhibitor SepF